MTVPFRGRRGVGGFPRAIGLCGVLAAGAARAEVGGDIPCGPVERGNIHIDGLTSDWEGVPALELAVERRAPAQSPSRLLRASLRCNYDDQALYLLVSVEDDVFLRSAAAAATDDHIELAFAAPAGKGKAPGKTDDARALQRLSLWPASSNPRLPRKALWSPPRPTRVIDGEGPVGRLVPLRGPPAIEVFETLQPKGYAVELRLPYPLIPGYRPGLPLPLGVRVVDGDSRAAPAVVATAQTGPMDQPAELSRVQAAEVQSGLESLFEHLKLTQADLWWEKNGDLGNGPARILMLGRNLVALAKDYGYQEVAATRADVREVQMVDLGDGKQAVLVRATEHGGGGTRETLRAWALRGGRFTQLLGVEVGKQVGGDALRCQVSVVAGSGKKGKGPEIVIVPQPPVGYKPETYMEVPAEDVQPILLPWRDRRARYVYREGRFSRVE